MILAMKGRLNKDYITSDGISLPEGTEVEMVNGYCTTEGYNYECIVPSGEQKLINSEAVTITDNSPWRDWQQITINAAISIAQGFAANSSFSSCGEDYVAKKSVLLATKLVETLRKEI